MNEQVGHVDVNGRIGSLSKSSRACRSAATSAAVPLGADRACCRFFSLMLREMQKRPWSASGNGEK